MSKPEAKRACYKCGETRWSRQNAIVVDQRLIELCDHCMTDMLEATFGPSFFTRP